MLGTFLDQLIKILKPIC